jgi:hypothetical protein
MANRAAGAGKSRRIVYRVAVRLLTPSRTAISARPTTRSGSDGIGGPYDADRALCQLRLKMAMI